MTWRCVDGHGGIQELMHGNRCMEVERWYGGIYSVRDTEGHERTRSSLIIGEASAIASAGGYWFFLEWV